MAAETSNTKFPRTIKGLESDYGGSDVDEVLLQATSQVEQAATEDAGTDYGSEFDSEADEEVTRILAELGGVPVVTEPLIEEENESGRKCLVHIPNVSSQRGSRRTSASTHASSYYTARENRGSEAIVQEEMSIDVDIPELSTLARYSEEPQNGQSALLFPLEKPEAPLAEVGAEGQAERKKNTRTPIERFRRPPKKPFSVTDIVSPAWCELQYWFSLTKFGKVRQTPAMRQGTKVHKELEERVHTYVEIEVKSREDIFGLRMWNIIQGLRTLRAIGLTRELEIWGVLDGEVINGVIDELSYNCPDPELESTVELSKENSTNSLPPGQKTISDFYASQQQATNSAWLGNPHPTRKIYVTDIKTRATKYLPKGAQLRGVQMQLSLYHKLLTELASNTVEADTIFARYGLDAHTNFTTSFINRIAELEDNFIHERAYDDEHATSHTIEDQSSELSQHNSLTRLWSLMITEFQRTIPSPAVMSEILQVEYRKGKDGTIMGNQCFVYDSVVLDRYLATTMDWWKGRREAKGVEIEEAFKCGVCGFAEGCEWRKEKVEAGIKKAREKKRIGERKWKV